MRHPIVLSEAARQDIGRAAGWYLARAERLAREFLVALGDFLEDLESFPRRHPVSHLDVRRGRLRRFPYMVLYVLRRDRVHVIGCIHLHRDPRLWRARRD